MVVFNARLAELRREAEETYRQRTGKSAELHEQAKRFMPGGDTRTAAYFEPYPLFMDRGNGCQLIDVDGNHYLDFLSNYTSLIHGHAHPTIIEVVSRQLRKGTSFATPLEAQIHLAQILTERIPSMEQVRFCNSGTEATMFAIRTAKAFTMKDKIIKMEGGYHGSHDAAQVSFASGNEAVSDHISRKIGDNRGLFRGVIDDVVVVPFNDVKATAAIIERHQCDLAAVIIEPVMGAGGIIPATPEYLQFLRTSTRACGALLIFDEVITFRLSYGGAQELYGVVPDLTTLGKIIGGGFPVGAFGGRGDLMSLYDPQTGPLSQSGTFNGNAITMVAGRAALELLTRKEISRINLLGERLQNGFRDAMSDFNFPAQVTRIGSLLGVQFTKNEMKNYRVSAHTSKTLLPFIHLSMLNKGIFTASRWFLCTSTPMVERGIETAVQAFRETLHELSTMELVKDD
jgi:glutamate-1-semialdehyde 2,1-aminomutase